MDKLIDIMFYLCKNYPYENELSNARLTKLVYLSDWFSSLVYHKQISNISWVFNHYGPYVDDIIEMANSTQLFDVISQNNYYGSTKILIKLNNTEHSPSMLSVEDINVLDFVINKTKFMYFNEFIEYVYSTYPVSSSNRFSHLNLPVLADEYRKTLE